MILLGTMARLAFADDEAGLQRTRCGFKPASVQMRPTLDGLMPISAAIEARLQCVAFRGVSLAVLVNTLRFTVAGNGFLPDGRPVRWVRFVRRAVVDERQHSALQRLRPPDWWFARHLANSARNQPHRGVRVRLGRLLVSEP